MGHPSFLEKKVRRERVRRRTLKNQKKVAKDLLRVWILILFCGLFVASWPILNAIGVFGENSLSPFPPILAGGIVACVALFFIVINIRTIRRKDT